MTVEVVQKAIHIAVNSDLPAVGEKTFYFCEKAKAYLPRPNCLNEYYSGGESVVCSVLLQMYFARYGTPSTLVVSDDFRTWFKNSLADLIWPGAYYFYEALNRLSDENSWHAIKILLPADMGNAE